MESSEFSQLHRAFMGGHTHANSMYVEKILHDVASQDFASSYPAVMLLEKFPMSKAHFIDRDLSDSEMRYFLKTKACLFDLTLTGVYHKLKFEHPIPRSKCWECVNPITDNGRIVMADKLSITCTEQDFATYSEFYDWEEISIGNFRYYDKQYLPHSFVNAILGLYEKKTVLKDVAGEEINYMISKNMLNAAFGMCVTNPVRDEIEYAPDNIKSVEVVKPVLEEAIDSYNKNVRRFLFYPWGVWITAYARRNLFSGIKELADDFVYSDTDSMKYLNHEKHEDYFKAYNANVLQKIESSADFHHIDVSKFSPLNKNGKKKTIGVWDFEGVYDDFKTLGAKRYIYRIGDDVCVTLAGANKKKTAEYLVSTGDPFGKFDNNLCIPAEYSGRLTSTYIDEEQQGTVVDYLGVPYNYRELSAIHLEPSDYNLTMSDAFTDYLKGVREGSYGF